jgi:hypothetical protein
MSFYFDFSYSKKDSLQKCCDLSQMWYREFYLEMTMGKKIQVKKNIKLFLANINCILNCII